MDKLPQGTWLSLRAYWVFYHYGFFKFMDDIKQLGVSFLQFAADRFG